MSPKEMLEHLIQEVYREGKGMSIAITLADEDGICSTVKVAKGLEEAQPGHMDRQLVILNAMYYKRYVEEGMEPTQFVVDATKGGSGTVQ